MKPLTPVRRFLKIPNELFDYDLHSTAILTWGLINRDSNKTGSCVLSTEELSQILGKSDRQTRKLLDALMSKGLIKRERQRRVAGYVYSCVRPWEASDAIR